MRFALVLLLQTRAAAPAVGDTVWVERVFGDLGAAVVRPQAWSLGALADQLGPAEVTRSARGVVVRYPLVFWYPGDHAVTMPGPVLVSRDGSSDTLAATPLRVHVASVLPPGRPKSTLEPRPASRAIPLAAVTPLPAVALAGFVLLLVTAVTLRARRRGKAIVRPHAAAAGLTPEVLRRWEVAGEYRVALEGWRELLLRRAPAERDPDRSRRLEALLAEVRASLFGVDTPEHWAALCARAAELAGG